MGDNAVFTALDLVYLLCLSFYTHIFMNHTQAAFTGERNCKLALRNGVHGRAQKRNIQRDVVRKPGGNIHLRGDHVGIFGNEQYVVKR